MREIKFRAWDKGNMIMCGPTGFGEPVTDFIHWNTDRYELMQFTGLLDKNGKEIYQSDLVWVKDSEIIGEVIWFNLSWQIKDGGMLCLFSSDDLEVVGDVYEK